MPVGVAAGHPATAEVGLRTLIAGGSAADAAVAAMLTSCVAESILTGIGGGGFATYYDATTGIVTCLDFFCAVPGLDGDLEPAPMLPIEVAFGDVAVPYLIGGSSVAIPGVPAGAGEVHRRWGRLPWRQVVQPAITLAASGVVVPAAQARTLTAVAPALLPGDGAAVYAPQGRLLEGGDLLRHPGLDTALRALAEEGPAAFYTGWIAERTIAAVRAQGGCLGPRDLADYRVLEPATNQAALAGKTISGRADLNQTIATLASLPADLATLSRPDRAVTLAHALSWFGRHRLGDTTNISVVDAEGNACVITTTLGIGAGVWVPGLGIHLNSMLGEVELITPDLAPGGRMSSMMCPLVVVDEQDSLVLAAGSAGASRIRSALVGVLLGVLVDGESVGTAISAPRLHAVPSTEPGLPTVVHVEPGFPPDELAALTHAGFMVNQWDHQSHYFGGVSAVGDAGAAGDPRRGGVGLLLP